MPACRDLDFSTVPIVASLVRRFWLEPGELLFRQGDTPRYVYLVREGLVKLTRCSSVGRQLITELLFPGDACDLLSAFDEQLYGSSGAAAAKFRVQVDCVPREAFAEMARRDPGTIKGLLAGWRTRLKFQREIMVSIALERVEQRVLHALLMLSQRVGLPVPSVRASIADMSRLLTRREFSELVGTSQESAIRALSDLKRVALPGPRPTPSTARCVSRP